MECARSYPPIFDIRTEAVCQVQDGTMVSPKTNCPMSCILHEKNLKARGKGFFSKCYFPDEAWALGAPHSPVWKSMFAFDGAD